MQFRPYISEKSLTNISGVICSLPPITVLRKSLICYANSSRTKLVLYIQCSLPCALCNQIYTNPCLFSAHISSRLCKFYCFDLFVSLAILIKTQQTIIINRLNLTSRLELTCHRVYVAKVCDPV